jgi:putative FmdB family regulatory protein
MPIYEYECTQCGKIEEVLQKCSDEPLTKCGYCSGNLHKIMSHSSFHLKGTGWYVTDYANKSKHTSSPAKDKGKTATSANGESNKTAGKPSTGKAE